MKYKIFFAPIQGYTEDVYRRLHKEIFGGIDTYCTPFIRLEHGVIRSKDIRDIRPDFNEGVNLMPQIIAADASEAAILIEQLINFNYKHIDINMGCPFPLQTRHGKGAGLMALPDKVKDIIDSLGKYQGITFSVKMRLGLDDNNQWRDILPILNKAHLTHITVHPRIATQQYKGDIDIDSFNAILSESAHPVIYNGDIRSVDDILRLEDTYGERLHGVMIGRGLLSRPSLACEYADSQSADDAEVIRKMKLMHSKLQEHYSAIIPGESQQLNKLRTFWDYAEDTLGRKQWKKIMKAGNAKNYLIAVNAC